jgi:hypothetical protein
MLGHAFVYSAFALGLVACAGSDPGTPGDEAAESEVGSVSSEWRRRSWRTWSTSADTGGTLVTRQTSDGELIEVFVPEPAPTIEVPAGGTCGVVNAQGVLLSCAPGTYCLSPADGVPGTCQVAPSAPRSEG